MDQITPHTVDPASAKVGTDFLAKMFATSETGRFFVGSRPNDASGLIESPHEERFIPAPHNAGELPEFLQTWDRPGRAMFFCTGILQDHALNRRKVSIKESCFLHIDIDLKHIDLVGSVDALVNKLRGLRCPPSVIVASGHGAHAYWLFTEPVGFAEQERVEAALKLLADCLGGDREPTHVAAFLRLPGSHNTKDGGWAEVKIVEANGHRYEFDDIEEWLSETAVVILRKTRERARTVGETDFFEQYGKDHAYKAPVDVEARLNAMGYGYGDTESIHITQRDVTSSLLSRGGELEEVVTLVLGATKAAAGEYSATWNWDKEECAIRGMCATWLKKHPQDSGQVAQQAKQQHGISLEHYENFGTTVSKNWIIKNVIAEGETSSWIGPPGAGKSALVTDLAIHIASGKDWRGHRSKQQCGVVYLALERGELVKRRLIAHAGQTLGFPVKLPFSIARQVIDLLKPTCVGEIVATINSAAEHHGCKIGVIIIDTYAKGIAAGGGDENSAKDQNMTLANLRRVQEETGVHIALVGHTGKDETKGPRGSNAFVGDVDMMVQFAGDKDARVATIIKNNDGAEGLLTRYKLEVAVLGKDDDGDDITTAIISADKLDSDKDISRAKLNKTQRKAMEMLERAIVDEGRDVPISSEYPRGIGKMVKLEVWKACCTKGGLSAGNKESTDKAFRRVVSDLDDMHRIGVWDGNVWIAYD